MSLRSMKIVAWGATHSAHDEMDVECFHCHALKALEELMALEKTAKALAAPEVARATRHAPDDVREALALMRTVATEAE